MDALDMRVEEMIRSCEVRALANLLRSVRSVSVGQVVDYFVEPETAMGKSTAERKRSSYRVAVEQWHLDGAKRMLWQTQGK